MKKDLKEITLLEMVEEILSENGSKILWENKGYKNITKKQYSTEDEYTFKNNDNKYGEVRGYSIGNSKLNVNLKVKYNGEVINTISKLKMDASIYKEYCLIRNGKINVETLITVLNKNLRTKYRRLGYILYETELDGNRVSIINLKKLSIPNNDLIKNITSKELVNKIYKLEVLKVEKKCLKNLMEQLLENDKDFVKNHLDTLERQNRKLFRINDKGIYTPLNNYEKEEVIQDMYVANICEWKVEKFPKTRFEKEFLELHKNKLINNTLEDYGYLKRELERVENERKELEKLVNKVKLYSIIENKNLFTWEKKKEKEKTNNDKDMRLNMVVGNKTEISTTTIGDITLKQEKYLKLIKH